jgi:hypothetical protein
VELGFCGAGRYWGGSGFILPRLPNAEPLDNSGSSSRTMLQQNPAPHILFEPTIPRQNQINPKYFISDK